MKRTKNRAALDAGLTTRVDKALAESLIGEMAARTPAIETRLAPVDYQADGDRCPSCGSLPSKPHLRSCKIMRRPDGPLRNTPTVRQMDLAFALQRELGRAEPIDPATLTLDECSKLIDRLLAEKEEGGGDDD